MYQHLKYEYDTLHKTKVIVTGWCIKSVIALIKTNLRIKINEFTLKINKGIIYSFKKQNQLDTLNMKSYVL